MEHKESGLRGVSDLGGVAVAGVGACRAAANLVRESLLGFPDPPGSVWKCVGTF